VVALRILRLRFPYPRSVGLWLGPYKSQPICLPMPYVLRLNVGYLIWMPALRPESAVTPEVESRLNETPHPSCWPPGAAVVETWFALGVVRRIPARHVGGGRQRGNGSSRHSGERFVVAPWAVRPPIARPSRLAAGEPGLGDDHVPARRHRSSPTVVGWVAVFQSPRIACILHQSPWRAGDPLSSLMNRKRIHRCAWLRSEASSARAEGGGEGITLRFAHSPAAINARRPSGKLTLNSEAVNVSAGVLCCHRRRPIPQAST